MPLTLHYAPDNASLCVRLALLALDLPFETQLVDRSQNAQNGPAYIALNPNGLILTLMTPDGPIYETGAILLWLADQKPEQVFLAVADSSRGAHLAWLFWLSNTLHPALRITFYPTILLPPENPNFSALENRYINSQQQWSVFGFWRPMSIV